MSNDFEDDLFDDEPDVVMKIRGGIADVDVALTVMFSVGEQPLGIMPLSEKKIPVLKKWTTEQPVHDPDAVKRWWKEYGAPNIGVVTGRACGAHGLVVVEADNDAGQKWIQENLPTTLVRVESRRGFHNYYAHPQGEDRVKNSADVLGSKVLWDDELQEAGYKVRSKNAKEAKAERARAIKERGECPYPIIDIKADGGQVVGPWSKHHSGHIYKPHGFTPEAWAERPVFDYGWFPDRYRSKFRYAKPAKDLEDLRELAKKLPDGTLRIEYDPAECTPERKMTRAMAYMERCDPAVSGQNGHAVTFFVACRCYVGFDLTYPQAFELMEQFSERCDPPWEPLEIEHKLLEAEAHASEVWGCMLFDREEYAEKKRRRAGYIEMEMKTVAKEAEPEELTLDEDGTEIDPEDMDDTARHMIEMWGEVGVDFIEMDRAGTQYNLKDTRKGPIIHPCMVNLCAIMQHGSDYGGKMAFDGLRMRPTLGGKPMEDHHAIQVLKDMSFMFGDDIPITRVEQALVNVGRINTYEPVVDYLEGLKWDGEDRIGRICTDVLRVRRNHELSNQLVTKWFISAVARVLQPGCKVDTALILQGKQGALKSTFFSILGGEFFTDQDVDLKDKDSMLLLGTNWIWEWSELQHVTNPKKIDQVKSFLSRTSDQFRPPYGRHMTTRPRRCSIVGTTNDSDIAFDASGARRLWIVPVGRRMNLTMLEGWRDQLWAQAKEMFLQGNNWWLSEEDEEMLAEESENWRPDDPWGDAVAEWIARNNTKMGFTIKDVLSKAIAMDLDKQDTKAQIRVGRILKRLGYEKVRTRDEDGKRVNRWMEAGEQPDDLF